MPDREWEGCSHVTKIGFVFKFELVFSSNLFLVAWTYFWLSALTIRECRTYCQVWREIYDLPISSTLSSETTKMIRLHSYCDMLWIDGPHPHCDIQWARKQRLIAGSACVFLSVLSSPIDRWVLQYFFRSGGGGVALGSFYKRVLTAMMKECICTQKQVKGRGWGEGNDL